MFMNNIDFTEFHEHTKESYNESPTAQFPLKIPWVNFIRWLPQPFFPFHFLLGLPTLYKFPQQNQGYTQEPIAKQNPAHLNVA